MVFHFLFTGLLLTAAVIDLRTMTIPPWIPLGIALIAPLAPGWYLWPGILGGLTAGLVLLLPAVVKPGAFGGGDIKLAAACGFCLGAFNSIVGLWLAVTLSLLPALVLRLRKSSSATHISFAPFLAAGFAAAAFLF